MFRCRDSVILGCSVFLRCFGSCCGRCVLFLMTRLFDATMPVFGAWILASILVNDEFDDFVIARRIET